MRIRWRIKTSDGRQTDADVYLSLSGLSRNLPEIRIDNPDSNDNFESGDIDTGIIKTKHDLGPIQSGQLSIDMETADDDLTWMVDWVEVIDEESGAAYRAEIDGPLDEDGYFPVLRFREVTTERPAPEESRPPVTNPAPPAPAPAFRTLELFGMLNGKRAALAAVVHSQDGNVRLVPGGKLLIGHTPDDGFGLGGRPGMWSRFVQDSPAKFGLPPNVGILTAHGERALVVDSNFLSAAFGDNWQSITQP
jgi:hypothetical protein